MLDKEVCFYCGGAGETIRHEEDTGFEIIERCTACSKKSVQHSVSKELLKKAMDAAVESINSKRIK